MFVFYRRRSSVQQTLRRKEIKTKMYFCCMDVIAYYSIACSILILQSRKTCSWKALLFFVAHFNIFQLCPETWLVGTTSVWICRCSAIASIKSKRQVPDRSERDWPACTFIFSLSGKGWKYIFCTLALMPDLSKGPSSSAQHKIIMWSREYMRILPGVFKVWSLPKVIRKSGSKSSGPTLGWPHFQTPRYLSRWCPFLQDLSPYHTFNSKNIQIKPQINWARGTPLMHKKQSGVSTDVTTNATPIHNPFLH